MEYKVTLQTFNSMQYDKPSQNANVGNNSKFHFQSDLKIPIDLLFYYHYALYAMPTRVFVYSEVSSKGVDLSNAFIFDLFNNPAVQGQ